jgi:hypothetical protein
MVIYKRIRIKGLVILLIQEAGTMVFLIDNIAFLSKPFPQPADPSFPIPQNLRGQYRVIPPRLFRLNLDVPWQVTTKGCLAV